MAYDMKEDAVGIGVGVGYILLAKNDKAKGRIDPFKRYADIGAVGGVLGGLATQFFLPKYGEYGRLVKVAAWPLLAIAMYNYAVAADKRIGAGGSGSIQYVPVMTHGGRVGVTTGASPNPMPLTGPAVTEDLGGVPGVPTGLRIE